MKKMRITLLAVALAVVTAFSFTGCAVGKVDDSDKTVEVLIYNAGYGIDWFNKIADDFKAVTDYNVVTKEVASNDNFESILRAGGSNTTTDLLIVCDAFGRYIGFGDKMVSGYEYCLEPLDEVYNHTPEGESKTIGEKMWKDYRDSYLFDVEIDGKQEQHYYVAPWASGFSGLMYNKKVYADAGLSGTPRTTAELLEYADKVKASGKYAFYYSSDSGYWEYLFNTWWGQYETLKGVSNFYNAKISDNAIPDAVSSMGIFDQKGILESLKAVAACLDPSKGYAESTVEALDYATVQARFLNGNGAMMPCGDWLENEMKKISKVDTSNIMPMRTPIISAIADKLSFADENETVRETNLRDLVDYADGGTKPTYAAENTVDADAAIVSKARRVTYTIGNAHQAVIPVYATAKVGAKEFLKFMYSDKNLIEYMNRTSGSMLPFDIDYKNAEGYNGFSDFAKTKLDIMNSSDWMLFAPGVYPTSYTGNLNPVHRSSPYEILLGSRDTSTRTTPEALIQSTKTYYRSRLEKLLQDSGLL